MTPKSGQNSYGREVRASQGGFLRGVVKGKAQREGRITAGLWGTLASYPEPHQLCDRGLVLSQGTHIGILLEGGHVVVYIQHVDSDPARGLLPAPIPGNDC